MELQLKKGQQTEQFNIENATVHLQALKGVTVCCRCGWYTRLQQLQPNQIICQHSNTFAIGRVVRWPALERVLDSCHLAAKLMLLVASESISKSWVYGHHSSPHFLDTSLFLCLIGPWDHFDKESEPVTSYIVCIDIEADRTWENGTCSSSRGGCGEPFWLLGLETPWFSWAATSDTEFFGNFAQLSDSRFLFIKDACWYSCPDCPTIHNYSYSKSSFNAQSLHSYRSALKGLWHGSRDLLQQCLLLWGGKVGWWHDRC